MCDIEVRVVEARNLVPKTNGTADPYCLVIVDKQKKKTRTVKKSLNPHFNEPFTIDIGDAASFSVAIYDKASPGKSDFMGEVVIPVNGLKLDGTNNWFPLKERKNSKRKMGVSGEILLQFAIPNTTSPLTSSQMREVKQRLEGIAANPSGVIDLEGTAIDRLPGELFEKRFPLFKFCTLRLAFNKFIDFPDLEAFTKLELLDLSGNRLVSLPPTIGLLTSLKELYLNGNQLKMLPNEIGDLTALTALNLSNNRLKHLVDDLGNLRRLEALNVTGNPINALPEAIGECISMEVLDLSCCELTRLPEQFCYMTRLLELNLGSNRLEKLPENIGRMTRLVVLNLSDNCLRDLPLSLGLCTGLDKLGAGINLDRNPIDNPELMKKWKIGTDHLVDYLEKRIALSDKPVVFEEFPRVSFKERTTYLEKQQSKQPKPKSENPNSNSHSSLLPSKTSTATMSASTANLSNTNQISTRYNSFPLVKANAFSSSNPVTTNSPTDRKPLPVSNSNNSLEEKLRVLAAWAESTISGELNTKVQLLKERLRTAKTASEALKIAQLTTGIRPETEKIHALLLGRQPNLFLCLYLSIYRIIPI